MGHSETVKGLMGAILIADDKTIGEIMAQRVGWTPGHSSRVQAGKILRGLADLGQLEKGKGFYRFPGCKSEWQEHSKLITENLIKIYQSFDNPIIHREKSIEEVKLRPDAMCFIERDRRGLCFVLEILNQEAPEYLKMKRNVWESWQGATEYLSRLFKVKVKWFDFVTSQELDTYLKEMQ